MAKGKVYFIERCYMCDEPIDKPPVDLKEIEVFNKRIRVPQKLKKGLCWQCTLAEREGWIYGFKA